MASQCAAAPQLTVNSVIGLPCSYDMKKYEFLGVANVCAPQIRVDILRTLRLFLYQSLGLNSQLLFRIVIDRQLAAAAGTTRIYANLKNLINRNIYSIFCSYFVHNFHIYVRMFY